MPRQFADFSPAISSNPYFKEACMVLGMDWFTLIHVLISLVGIAAGLVLLAALMRGRNPDNWAALFLIFTVLTSVTGFFFKRDHILPSHIVGAVSLIALALAIYALYGRGLSGGWRGTYVVTVAFSLYLNLFVLVIQLFLKIPPLHAIAPGAPPSGPVFAATQLIVLVAMVIGGWISWRAFKPLKF
jgi:hypothetical protein